MSLIKSEKIENNRYELQFSADKGAFDKACQNAYRKMVVNVNIPGFRKGKAPRAIIEKMYGKGVFYEDAINEILPDAYSEAIKDIDLKLVGRPEFDIVSIDETGVVLSAKVYVKPEVAISDYFGLEVNKIVTPVDDAEVESELQMVRERYSREIDVTDRAAENGDTVKIDYTGYCDGKAFDGGSAKNYSLVLGSGSFIPGFEDQVVGHNVGESFDINVTFPAEYHSEELAGKAATFSIVLNSITKTELPELDDEFAKDASEFDTIDEYKADLKAKIVKRHENIGESDMSAKLSDMLIEKMSADIPQAMFDEEVDFLIENFAARLQSQGLSMDMYFKYTGLDISSVREQFKKEADHNVKERLALEKIAELESLSASDEDAEKEIADLASNYNMTVEDVKKSVSFDALKDSIVLRKAMELVKEKANITVLDSEPAAEKKDEAEKPKRTRKPSTTTKTASKSTKSTTAKSATAKSTKTAKAAEDTAEKEKAE